MRYILFNADGSYRGDVNCYEIDRELNTPEGCTSVQSDEQSTDIKLVDGVIVPIPQDEIDARYLELAWDEFRGFRNQLLLKSDWTQANDSPLSASKRTEWATYRQALRDLTENTVDPANPVWPEKPQ